MLSLGDKHWNLESFSNYTLASKRNWHTYTLFLTKMKRNKKIAPRKWYKSKNLRVHWALRSCIINVLNSHFFPNEKLYSSLPFFLLLHKLLYKLLFNWITELIILRENYIHIRTPQRCWISKLLFTETRWEKNTTWKRDIKFWHYLYISTIAFKYRTFTNLFHIYVKVICNYIHLLNYSSVIRNIISRNNFHFSTRHFKKTLNLQPHIFFKGWTAAALCSDVSLLAFTFIPKHTEVEPVIHSITAVFAPLTAWFSSWILAKRKPSPLSYNRGV